MILAYPDLPADLLERTARSSARRFAGPSATARPGRGWAWCPAAFLLDPFYLAHEHGARLRDAKAPATAMNRHDDFRAGTRSWRSSPRFSRCSRSSAWRSTGCHASTRSSSRNSAGAGSRSPRGTPTARSPWPSRSAFSPAGSSIGFGPRRLMLVGITMAGIALVGLSYVTSLAAFYFFYAFNALGYVCGGPLPNQVLLSRWFEKGRGKAMGIAYLGIGVGGALVPLLAYALTQSLRLARRAAVAGRPDDSRLAAGRLFRARAGRSGRDSARAPLRFRSRRSCRARRSICCSSAAWRRSARSAARCRIWRCI